MHTQKRNITHKTGQRYVEGIEVRRDFDVAIIFERNQQLSYILDKFKVTEIDDLTKNWSSWDGIIGYITLKSGAKVGLLAAKGPANAATAIERAYRSGASHIFSIGTAGSLKKEIKKYDVVVAYAGVREESTTDAYAPKSVPAVCNPILLNDIFKRLTTEKKFDTHLGVALTNCARFMEKPDLLTNISKGNLVHIIDMETSAVLLVSAIHNISCVSIRIITDSPAEKNSKYSDHSLSNISNLHGCAARWDDYGVLVPDRLASVVKASLDVFEDITSSKGYVIFSTNSSNINNKNNAKKYEK